MTDDQLELRLRDWYRAEIPADETAPPALRSRLVSIPRVSPLPRRRFASRRGVTLLAAAALVGVLAGSAAIGARFVTPPPVPPVVTSQLPSLLPSELESNQPSIAPATGRIVYTRWRTLASGEEDCTSRFGCHRASVAMSNDDGSGERVLFPDPSAHVLTVSHDGSKLIVSVGDSDGDHVFLTDADGSEPRLLDTHCQTPCLGDWGFTLSADGSRLAFNRTRAGEPGPYGRGPCRRDDGHDDWRGRGARNRPTTIGRGPACRPTVHASPSGTTWLMPTAATSNRSPRPICSPTSSSVCSRRAWRHHSGLPMAPSLPSRPSTPRIPNANLQALMEIYVVRPDGSGLQRLTTDTDSPRGREEVGDFGANFPTWTRDGRIAFIRYPAREEDLFELWVMDADGGNATRVEESNAAALTALGCVSCPYPARTYHEAGVPSFAFWIPGR